MPGKPGRSGAPPDSPWRQPIDPVECGYPGCRRTIHRRLWGCKEHSLLVPIELRDRLVACTRERDRDRVRRSIRTYLEIYE